MIPKQLKLHLGKLKEGIDATTSLRCAFNYILYSELAQRSVLLSPKANDTGDNDDAHYEDDTALLWTTLHSTAGKLQLDDSMGIPKPMIAGTAVVSAMALEKCAELLNDKTSSSLLVKVDSNCRDRCKEVGDERFGTLLNVMMLENPSIQILLLRQIAFWNLERASAWSNPDVPPMFKKAYVGGLKFQATFRAIKGKIEGGTESNGLLDTMEEEEDDDYLNHYNGELYIPLLELRRIAQSKGNHKRVSELTLRLVQSYLTKVLPVLLQETKTTTKATTSWLGESGSKLYETIPITFSNRGNDDDGDDNGKTPKPETPQEVLGKACQLLEEWNQVDDTDVKFITLAQVLRVQLEELQCNSIINTIVEERYQAIRNRGGIGLGGISSSKKGINGTAKSTTTATSKVGLMMVVRGQILTQSLPKCDLDHVEEYDPTSIHNVIISLRDHVLAIHDERTNKESSSAMYKDANIYLKKYVDRLVQTANVMAVQQFKTRTKKLQQWTVLDVQITWNQVLNFVRPMMESHGLSAEEDATMTTMAEEWGNLLDNAAKACIKVAWMSFGRLGKDDSISFSLIQTATNHLVARKKIRQEQEIEAKKKEQNEAVIRTVNESNDKSLYEDEHPLLSGEYMQFLASVGEDNSTNETMRGVKRATEQMLKMVKESEKRSDVDEYETMYGTPFVLFLVCWSGLQMSSWPFCNVSQARSIMRYTRERLRQTPLQFGRRTSSFEDMLLMIGEADVEGGQLNGGFAVKAKKLYNEVLEKIEVMNPSAESNKEALLLLKSHCQSSLSRILLQGENAAEASKTMMDTNKSFYQKAEMMSKNSLELLLKLNGSSTGIYCWTHDKSFQASIQYHICLTRQLVAESLLRLDKASEAHESLREAVSDSPNDFDANLALGAFYLRMAFHGKEAGVDGSEYRKKAQKQLLMSAKLDSTKADPFALLGYWYEIQNDEKRAYGCYSKALSIDPSHPVSGRGVLRIKALHDVIRFCDVAISLNTIQNGWGWRALGKSKAFDEGDDETAVLYFQQALRCRDVENVDNETYGLFYDLPNYSDSNSNDCALTWSALAGCYRRLGKFTASLRAYQSAFDVGACDVESQCAWAQVQLDLGLIDEATSMYESILSQDNNDSFTCYNAALGAASCLALLAKRETDDGKFGLSLKHLRRGIELLEFHVIEKSSDEPLISALKLAGDLYSCGYLLPFSVFLEHPKSECLANALSEKEKFINNGESLYRQNCSILENLSEKGPDHDLLVSAAHGDLGTSTLLQARVSFQSSKEGSGVGDNTSIYAIARSNTGARKLLEGSVENFTKAIESNELNTQAWCGLGCSIYSIDPMLAQHAFCRALQIDKSLPDAWANLGLLYGEFQCSSHSEEAVNILTQVADTPLMWICRGLLLENDLDQNREQTLCRAADAYRASLQVTCLPSALLGLSLTCRRTGVDAGDSKTDDYTISAKHLSGKEAFANMCLFSDRTSGYDLGASILGGIMDVDNGVEVRNDGEPDVAHDLMREGIKRVKEHTSIAVKDKELIHDKMIKNESDLQVKDQPGLPTEELESISISLETSFQQNVQKESSVSSFQSLSDINKDLRQNPDDGECWLNLAKCILFSVTEQSTPSKETLKTVLSAIGRAKYILKNQAIEPVSLQNVRTHDSNELRKSVPSRPIKAEIISDAFALSSWAEDLVSSCEESRSSFDVQRALILDPENRYARAKLP